MYSLKRRLLLVLAAGFALVIAGTGLYAEHALDERVTEEFDATLLAKARELIARIEAEDGQIVFDYEPGAMPEFTRTEAPEYFQIWLDDGSVLYRSQRIGEGDLARGGDAPYDAALPDGRPGRCVEIAFRPAAEDEPDEAGPQRPDRGPAVKEIDTPVTARSLVLVVARGRERLDGLIGRVRVTLLGMGGLATLLGALLAWRALVVGFRPVDQIAAQVRSLDAEHLDARVHVARPPRELAPIVEQLNALLERLAAAFARERRFTANVAHELRTPIAELRALADVGGKWPDDTESVRQFFGDVGDIATRMDGLIADLLLLARCQAGVERARLAPVALREAVEETWARLAPAAARRRLRFALDVPAGLAIESDPGKLAIVLSNVLGNAVSYATEGTEVRCAAAREDGRFRLEVGNEAEPLAADDLARLTEPFWRKDEARAPDGHAGLGLSVVVALAELLGHEIAFDQDQNGTFRVRLEGPAATRDPVVA